MSTPHINAEKGEIASTVLLPGDPLRAKFIADNFLDNVKRYNTVRNAFGYTGTYKGTPVSVQATGMGMPSIGIYTTELIKFFDVQNLIRIGTAGTIAPDVHVRDIVIAEGASSGQSGYVNSFFDKTVNFAPIANFDLLDEAVHQAKSMDLRYHVGNALGEDRFYNDYTPEQVKYLASFGILACEMEIPALYTIAAKYHRRALGILTVSDNIVTGEATTPEERQTGFKDMMNLSLETVVNFTKKHE
ncbi:MAG: purine-nucleoside phosphorylase [Lactobacillus sp.]|jgi:purine-nucleoside phosphorylase|nr:purine-nucleoside phosphorylase [Lactobacillus sp.]